MWMSSSRAKTRIVMNSYSLLLCCEHSSYNSINKEAALTKAWNMEHKNITTKPCLPWPQGTMMKFLEIFIPSHAQQVLATCSLRLIFTSQSLGYVCGKTFPSTLWETDIWWSIVEVWIYKNVSSKLDYQSMFSYSFSSFLGIVIL